TDLVKEPKADNQAATGTGLWQTLDFALSDNEISRPIYPETRSSVTMKTFITMLVAAAVSLAVVRAADQESVGEKASDALETTKEKTKEAGRAVVHTTKKAANAVADALTPEAGARQIKV